MTHIRVDRESATSFALPLSPLFSFLYQLSHLFMVSSSTWSVQCPVSLRLIVMLYSVPLFYPISSYDQTKSGKFCITISALNILFLVLPFFFVFLDFMLIAQVLFFLLFARLLVHE
jgi:hypothetical protein